jgi:hypothetical protein
MLAETLREEIRRLEEDRLRRLEQYAFDLGKLAGAISAYSDVAARLERQEREGEADTESVPAPLPS